VNANFLPDARLGDVECEVQAVETFEKKDRYSGFILGGLFLAGTVALVILEPSKRAKDYILLAVLLALTLFGFVYGYLKVRRPAGKRIIVHSGGLVCLEGDQALTCPWPEVLSIKEALVDFYINDLYSHTNRFLTVTGRDGTVIEFGGPPKEIGKAADAVTRHAYHVILPRTLTRLAEGKWVRLGPLTVSETAIRSEQGELSWAAVGGVKVEKGHLLIVERGSSRPWFKGQLGDIENYRILLALFEQHGVANEV
jgi:hypothetical protein